MGKHPLPNHRKGYDPTLDPEIELWIAVIRQAIHDYCVGIPILTSFESCSLKGKIRKLSRKKRLTEAQFQERLELMIKRHKHWLKWKKNEELQDLKKFLFVRKAEPFNLQWICAQIFPDNDIIPEMLRARLNSPAEWWFTT